MTHYNRVTKLHKSFEEDVSRAVFKDDIKAAREKPGCDRSGSKNDKEMSVFTDCYEKGYGKVCDQAYQIQKGYYRELSIVRLKEKRLW